MRIGSRLSAALAALFACAGVHAAEPVQGPTSSQPSYFTPTATGWTATSLITAGDGAQTNGYRLVGNADGTGAIAGRWDANLKKYVDPTLYMTVYMDHELDADVGIVRAHGQKGSFVSQWTVELETLKVTAGEDLIRKVFTWNNTSNAFQDTTGATVFTKLCSANLPPQVALFDKAGGKGYSGRVFFDGEETSEGRAFMHLISGAQKGTSYQLPYMGHAAWENILAWPFAGPQTVVIGINDGDPGQLYVYVGTKQSTGSPLQKAGLMGGKLYGIKVVDGGPNYGNGPVIEENNGAINGRFTLVDVSSAALGTAAQLETASDAAGVSQFARPEDGNWDPSDPRNFYFNATGTPPTSTNQTARVYRLRFDDTTSWPTGGTIELVVDSASLTGKDGQTSRSFDNMTVNAVGEVLAQEDPGSTPYLAKTWKIKPADPLAAMQVLASNSAFFTLGSPTYHTQTEEHTGIIEVTSLLRKASWYKGGRRYYLTNMMDHKASTDPEITQGGQLNLVSGPK